MVNRKRNSAPKVAPELAKYLRELVRTKSYSQRELASKARMPLTTLSRLCNLGVGSENNICVLLRALGVKRRDIPKYLIQQRIELSDGEAHNVWRDLKGACLSEEEYLANVSPLPAEQAYACTQLGIPVGGVAALAKRCNISNIESFERMPLQRMVRFLTAFESQFGRNAVDIIMAAESEKSPPVLVLDLKEQRDAAEYLELTNCDGKLFFDLPNLVIGDYHFSKDGKIGNHRNYGGVELLYSVKGDFELTSQGRVCQPMISPGRFLLVHNAREEHAIRLAKGKSGRLLMVRYDPRKKDVEARHLGIPNRRKKT